MLNNFEEALVKTINNENSITENGAIGYKTTGKKFVDFNFKMSSYRNLSEKEIENDFSDIYNENPVLATKMLFFTGDIREGMGERRTFNTCVNWMANNHPEIIKSVIHLIPEYNRWDSAINLILNNNVKKEVIKLIEEQIIKDKENMMLSKSISLLAKWMPSINTSSKNTVNKAYILIKELNYSPKKYRKMLSSFRKYLNIVETKMSSNNWKDIDYNIVPSKANLIYKEAFIKHDAERRTEYLNKLENGEAKINSSVSFPYDIIHKYDISNGRKDTTLEEMWKALPDYINGKGSDTICVVDGSGSMQAHIGNTNVTAQDVARSLGIYFADKMQGAFHNKFITFSRNPKLITFNDNSSLFNKIKECDNHSECENTDIEKVFDLILKTAIQNHLIQEELPKNILILSDMEFDNSSIYIKGIRDYYYIEQGEFNTGLKTLFDDIKENYEKNGYKMPKLIFWNICSRTNTIPVKENENGVTLVSGFSPTIASMVFSEKLNPYDVIVEKLNSKRYEPIDNIIKNII